MSLLFSVLLLYNRRGDFYNKVKRKSTGAELMTIKEIAKLAQVSSAAVSRYMNGGYVSEEKKERIRAVIEETGYRPSVQARTLRTKRACLVGVIVPKINSESISRITEGIGQVLSERAYQMLLTITDNDPSKELEYMDLFESYPVDGIILVGTVLSSAHKEKLKKCRVPIVVIGQQTNEVSCIYHDDYGAAKELAEQIGKEMSGRIAYIGVTREDKAAGAAREDGFRDGLRAVGRELEEGCLRRASFTMESGYEQACDHVLYIVSMSWAVNVCIVTFLCFVLNVSCRDCDSTLSLFWSFVDVFEINCCVSFYSYRKSFCNSSC